MRRAGLIALVLVLGCQADEPEGGLERSEFVATYVDLRRVTRARAMDDATRDSILEAHNTSAAELRAYIEQRADDPEAIAATWREIMDSIAARDSVATQNDTL